MLLFRIVTAIAVLGASLGLPMKVAADLPHHPVLDLLLLLSIGQAEREYGGSGGDALELSYEDGNKHLAYITGRFPLVPFFAEPKASLYFDLDDYYSSLNPSNYITPEGSEGWITVWIDGGAEFLTGGSPIGMGIRQVEMPSHSEPARINEQDPLGSFEESTILSGCLAGLSVTGFTVESDGSLTPGEADVGCIDFTGSLVGVTTNILRFEIQAQALGDILTNVYVLHPGQRVVSTDIDDYATDLISQIVENDPNDGDPSDDIFELILKDFGFRAFTPSDDGTNIKPSYAITLDYLHGGRDTDGDGIPDNRFPYLLSGMIAVSSLFEVKGHSIGNTQGDYYVKFIQGPGGWVFGAGDHDIWLYTVDRKVDLEDVNPGADFSAWFAVLTVSTDPEEGLVEFEYGKKICNPFCHDEKIDSAYVYLHKYDGSTIPPTNDPPEVQLLTTTAEVEQNTPLTVEATAVDTDLEQVLLYYSNDSGYQYTTASMTNTGGNTYQATIPSGSVVPPAVQYFVEAIDAESSSRSPASSDHMVTVVAPTPPPIATHTVSGYVRTSSGTGISGVTVAIGNLSAITLGNGSYVISGVPAGTHVITPTKYGFTFTPPEIERSITQNLTDLIFIGTADRDQDTWVFPLDSNPAQMEDTYISEFKPDSNYGTATTFRVGNVYTGGSYYHYRGLIRFNELKGTLSGMEVYNADLEMYVSSVTNQTSISVYGINDLDGYWYESSATWNNFPVDATQLNPSQNQTINGTGWRTFDVTTMTNNYVERYPNYGFVVRPSTLYSSQYNYASINSSEAGSNWPRLTVQVLTGTPDLTISRIDPIPSPGPGMTYEVGQTITIEWDVFNNGPGGANLTYSCVYLENNPSSLGNMVKDNQSSRLLAGSTDNEEETYTFLAGDAGIRYIVIQANCTGDISETRTDNNTHIFGPLNILPINNAPVLNPLPDQTIDEDTTASTLVDLWAYASDAETVDANLVYTIINNPDPAAGVSILNNRYIAVMPPASNWNGIVDVEVRVMDPGGKSDSDILRVTINPVNDPPSIVGVLPNQSVDSNTAIDIDLTPYESDPEDSGTNLDWYVTDLAEGVTLNGEYSDDDILSFTPATDYAGTQVVILHLVDSAGLEDSAPLWLTWNSQAQPPGAFNKSSPANGATGVSTSPTLSWGGSSGATSYEYCYDTSNDNACDGSWVSVGLSTSVGLSGLSAGTTYYWQVRAVNAGGASYANANTWWSFTITDEYQIMLPVIFKQSADTPAITLFSDDFSTARGWIDESGWGIYRDTINNWLVWQVSRDTKRRYYIPIPAVSGNGKLRLKFRIKVTAAGGNGDVVFGLAENLDGTQNNPTFPTGFFMEICHNTLGIDHVWPWVTYSDRAIFGGWVEDDPSTYVNLGAINVWRRIELVLDQGVWTIKAYDDNGTFLDELSGILPKTHSLYHYLIIFRDATSGWEWQNGLLDDVELRLE